MSDRDPLLDPRPGDRVRRTDLSRSAVRRVVDRDGGDIYYEFQPSNHQGTWMRRKCWISTWMEWCRANCAVEEYGNG